MMTLEKQESKTGRFEHLRWAVSQLRIKITLPYVLLAIIIAFATAFLVTRLLNSLLENRFETALLDAGRMASDSVVRLEREQLAVWRAIAYTEGFAGAVEERDAQTIDSLARPLIVNANLDCLEVLDSTGRGLTALHHVPGEDAATFDQTPGTGYADWEIVQWVLEGRVDEIGDKYADLIETDWGWVFYTAGPIKQRGEVVGVLLVGTYLDRVVERLDAATLARVSVYVGAGPPLETTLSPEEPEALTLDEGTYQDILEQQENRTLRRDVMVAEREYAEVFGSFEARHHVRDMGVLSVALPTSMVSQAGSITGRYLAILFGVVTVLVVLTGTMVANTVVRRLHRLAAATHQVAQGNLDTRVDLKGYDELASLANDFNEMVVQLQEGRLYRDLLGLTTSPEVAEKLREGLARGQLQLEGQSVIATVLFADIRGFTRLSEEREPAEVIRILNDYLQGLIAIIREHNGVINKFAGDAALAFFGVLPEPRPPEQSARDALAAALAIQVYIEEFNQRRQELGEEPLRIGIGVNTGLVVVGPLGSAERMEYTIIGDTVNVTQRLSDLNKEYPDYDLFIGPETYKLMEEGLQALTEYLGSVNVKGRATPVEVYVISML